MQQDKIWDYLQNDGLAHGVFPEARQRFVVRYLKAGQTVLNIGVGAGILERLALAKGVDIHALDPSEGAIERLRKELGLGDRAQAGYAQAIPFGEGKFDVVVMSEVLEHLGDETLDATLQEVRRVLAPGGFLLATVPYKEDLGINIAICPDCGKVFHRMGHVQSFDRQRMASLLRAHGYDTSRMWVTTFVDWRRSGALNFVKSVARIILARLGEGFADPHLIAIATKIATASTK